MGESVHSNLSLLSNNLRLLSYTLALDAPSRRAANDVASITILFVGENYEDAGYYEDYERLKEVGIPIRISGPGFKGGSVYFSSGYCNLVDYNEINAFLKATGLENVQPRTAAYDDKDDEYPQSQSHLAWALGDVIRCAVRLVVNFFGEKRPRHRVTDAAHKR